MIQPIKISTLVALLSLGALQCIAYTAPNLYQSANAIGSDEGYTHSFMSGLGMQSTYLYIEGDYRAALIPHILELNGKIFNGMAIQFGGSIGIKYAFFQKDLFSMALFMEGGVSMFFNLQLLTLSAQSALLLTRQFTPDFSVTLAPRVLYHYQPFYDEWAIGSVISAGMTLTFDFGSRYHILPEIGWLTHFEPNKEIEPQSTFVLGIAVSFSSIEISDPGKK